ncbi:hypothetical protein Tco_1260813, partial [Tanacetum coccineum]
MLVDSTGFNAGVMMDTKRLPCIGESFGDLPDVLELNLSVFLDDVEANNMNVLDIGCSSSMQQNMFEVGHVHDTQQSIRDAARVGSSNPGVNANVESVGTNANRGTVPLNSVLNVMPKLAMVRPLLSSEKAVLECQVNVFKGKHLTCELDAARHKVKVERLVHEKKE